MQLNPKLFLRSKTLWYNTLTVLVFALTTFFGYRPNEVLLSNLQTIVTNPMFITAMNIFLRSITKTPLTLSPSKEFIEFDSVPPIQPSENRDTNEA